MTTRAYTRDAGTTIDVLFEISDAVNRTFDLNELFDVIHKSLGRILNVDNFFIATHNEAKDSISFDYWVSEIDASPGEITHFSNTSSITGEVINAKRPLIFYREDILNFAQTKKTAPIGSPSEIWLGAPLKIRGRVIGAISVQSFTSRNIYQPSDLDLLNSVSQHIALAIERKQSERAIKNQQIILEKILELSPVGITLVENQLFKWVNNEMVHLLGYTSKNDFTNKSFSTLFASRDEYDRVGKVIYNTLAEKGRASLDLDLIKKDGTILHAHAQFSSADSSNPLAWIILTISDISTRKQMEAEKIQHEKLQAVLEMAGAVCHELNQPLQAILGYSELVMMDQDPGSPLFRDLGIIRSQTTRIGTITKKLSEITKYKTVDYPGQTKIVDIWGSSTTLD
jgi:PAS domain S-box-containing protein